MSGLRTVVQWLCDLSQKMWRSLVYMNWIDRHRRVNKGVTVGNCRMNRFLFADKLVLHAWIFNRASARIWSVFWCMRPSRNENHHWKDWGIVSYKTPKAVFSASELQQVETFKYLGVVFTSDGSRNKGFDTRVGKANAVLRELYCSAVTKRELSNNAMLSVFKWVFVPILTCSHESQVTTEKILSNKQTAEMGYSWRVLSVTLRDKKHRSEVRKAQDVKPLFRIDRSHLC